MRHMQYVGGSGSCCKVARKLLSECVNSVNFVLEGGTWAWLCRRDSSASRGISATIGDYEGTMLIRSIDPIISCFHCITHIELCLSRLQLMQWNNPNF